MEASGFWWYRVRTPNDNKLLLIQVWVKIKDLGETDLSPGLAWTLLGYPPLMETPICVFMLYIYIPSFTSHQLVDLPSNSTWAEVFLKRWSSWRWVLRVAPRALQRSATARARPGGAEGGYLGYWDFRDVYIILWENCDFYELYGDFSWESKEFCWNHPWDMKMDMKIVKGPGLQPNSDQNWIRHGLGLALSNNLQEWQG